MKPGFAAALLVVATVSAVDAEPKFERVESPALTHIYTGGWEHFVGGGVAAFDCDGDLLPELYVAGGSAPASLLRNRSSADGLRFEAETPEQIALTGVTGAYPIDIDSDGHTDLAVLRVGQNILLRGTGDCKFTPFDLGFESQARWTTAFSATWEGQSRKLPTLAFGNYVDRSDPDGPFEACDQNLVYRPDSGRYVQPILLTPGYCALSMLFSDWGRNGRTDLRISNDRHYYVRNGSEQLWRMDPVPELYAAADGWNEVAIWGMGIASRDLTGDGIPEIFLTSMGDQKLHSLTGDFSKPVYKDAPYDKGITAHRPYSGGDGRPSTAWHPAFGDVDNDGRDDLFIAKGNVEAMPGSAIRDPNNLLMQEPDGRFAEKGDAAGLSSMERARGAALIDLDLDGRLDLVVVNRNAPLEIYRNVTRTRGNWLLIRPRQTGWNRDAVGGWLEVRIGQQTHSREITIGGGHASGQLGHHHFGLGANEQVDIRMVWPGGAKSGWRTVDANTTHILRRSGHDFVLE